MDREKTRLVGVYKRTSDTRRHDGKPDVCYDITYKDRTGKKVWEKVGWASEGYTLSTAAAKRAKRIREDRDGEDSLARGQSMTYAAAWEVFKDRWLPTLSRPDEEKSRYRLYIEPIFADKPLNRITTAELEDFKRGLQEKGLADATVRHILGDIRKMYRKMAAWGMYKGPMPMMNLSLPKPDNARMRYLTPDEAKSLMDALKPRSLTWWRIAMISMHAGLRLGEALSLRGRDINFNDGTIHVLDAKNGTRMAHITKTLDAVLREALPKNPADLLFVNASGRAMRASDTSKTFARVVKDLELNKGVTDRRQQVVFHTLRHTFCSWMAIRGVPLYTIGELAGHATMEMTKRYSHLCPDAKKTALNEVDDMAASSGKKKSKASIRRKHARAGLQGKRGRPFAGIKPSRRPLRKAVPRPGSA